MNHFLKVATIQPLFVLYDGHSSHVGLDLIETAQADNVHLFVLPPHSSHILQPLDVSIFGPFKKRPFQDYFKILSTKTHPSPLN